jgi:hypothetical protein
VAAILEPVETASLNRRFGGCTKPKPHFGFVQRMNELVKCEQAVVHGRAAVAQVSAALGSSL